MGDALVIFLRGLIQVAPVAASTYFVSHDRPLLAVAVGWWISFVWWWNAGSAAHLSGWTWATVYACGAATGTYLGQRAAQRLTREYRQVPVSETHAFANREPRMDVNGVEMTGP